MCARARASRAHEFPRGIYVESGVLLDAAAPEGGPPLAFSVENGCLTPSLKLRRRALLARLPPAGRCLLRAPILARLAPGSPPPPPRGCAVCRGIFNELCAEPHALARAWKTRGRTLTWLGTRVVE